MKKCKDCKKWKSLNDYYTHCSSKDRKQYICKICSHKAIVKYMKDNPEKRRQYDSDKYGKSKPRILKKAKEYYHKNKDKIKQKKREKYLKNKSQFKDTHLKNVYGISLKEFNSLKKKQKYKCKICKFKKKLGVDHCHKTNKIRGLLCLNCNTLLGHAKDSIKTLKNSIRYLNAG